MSQQLLAHVELLQHELVSARPRSSRVSDDELRELLVRLESLGSTLEAVQASVMLEMGHRAEAEDLRLDALAGASADTHRGNGRVAEFVADEIAVLLSCTRVHAARRLGVAMDAARHRELMHAWLEGRVDARKVDEIARGVAVLDCPDTVGALAIDPLVSAGIEYGESHTVSQLRVWLGRRVLAVAPEAAERRRTRALADRRVSFTPLTDGMAELCALLPVTQARQIFDTVDAVAHEAGSDDRRGMDARRADALVDLTIGRAQPPRVSLQVVVPADVLAGESDEPGWLAGGGPVSGSTVRELAGLTMNGAAHAMDVTLRRLVCDPQAGVLTEMGVRQYRPSHALERTVRARDVTCRFPGCRRSALGTRSGTDVDHTVPWPRGDTEAANLAVLCRRHHRLKHSPGWRVTQAAHGCLVWTTPTGRQFVTEPWQYSDPPPT